MKSTGSGDREGATVLIREWPVRERPRERLRAAGAAALSVRELIAILVGSGTEGRSAVDVAAELLHRADGSLRRLSAMSLTELETTAGVGNAVSARLNAALELGRRLGREGPTERARIAAARDVYALCAPAMRDLSHEEFHVLLLNTQNEVTQELTVTRGVLDGSLIHPREVFRPAIAESASALIVVHNHPSGDPNPSADDRQVTEQLLGASKIVGIPMLDHVVIGDGRYVSFVEAGLLARD